MYKNQQSLFIISLDFELLWGVRDKKTIANYGENIKGVRKVIPALLDLFSKYGVHATFATVGFLFARNKRVLLDHIPSFLPEYSLDKYSPYENQYLDTIGSSEEDDVYHYAYSLVELLRQSGQHEIASHTFSHFYCLEQASIQAFEADLLAAKKIAKSLGIELRSIVFPRNQYASEHIQICEKLGFTCYRGNADSGIYKARRNENQNKLVRAVRLLDAYLNLTGHHTYTLSNYRGIVNIPASRFLRPYSPKLAFLDGLRRERIKTSMTHAAMNGEAFHLWWHPHNFGVYLPENISFLEKILQHYQWLNRNYGMNSLTMAQIAEQLKATDAEAQAHFISR